MKADGATVTLTALEGGKIRVNRPSFDEPRIILKEQVFQVRSDGRPAPPAALAVPCARQALM